MCSLENYLIVIAVCQGQTANYAVAEKHTCNTDFEQTPKRWRKKEKKAEEIWVWSPERGMKVCMQCAECCIKLPDPGNHTPYLYQFESHKPYCKPQKLGEIAVFGQACRQEKVGLPGALPGPLWDAARVGFQLGKAQLGALFFFFFSPVIKKEHNLLKAVVQKGRA